MMLMALASPIPLNLHKSFTVSLESVFQLLPTELRILLASSTADSFREPLPMMMARSSESDKARCPFISSFSRGRSSSAQFLIDFCSYDIGAVLKVFRLKLRNYV